MNRTRYIALLRGINVGGHRLIKMDDLRAALAASGLGNVRTLLASGNVAFDAVETDARALAENLEATLLASFGWQIPVILRTADQVRALIASAPFQGVEVTPLTRLYVSFLAETTGSRAALPDRSPEPDFAIVRVSPTEVCSVLTLARTGSVGAMQTLETLFGPRVTTRNWNTVVRLASL
jgi:uncharacterized protein (DUF1697 family)